MTAAVARLNLPLAFAELLFGAVLVDAGIKGASLTDVIKGQATVQPLDLSGASSSGSGSTASSGSASGSSSLFGAGTTGGRLDQGQDLVAGGPIQTPVAGKVLVADANNAGWGGGGFIAIQMTAAEQAAAGLPSDIIYFAENIAPTVTPGQQVNAGDTIATPAKVSSYNEPAGGLEWGLANPAEPTQPLAQVVANASAMVLGFYKWARSVGAPAATSTTNAGSA